jgi:hypothetical protein
MSTLPIPCASKSRVIVTRDRSPSSSGSIVPMAIALADRAGHPADCLADEIVFVP